MNKGLVLAVSLTAATLALIPWLSNAISERLADSHAVATSAAPASPSSGASPIPRSASSAGPVARKAPHSDSYCLTCHGKPSLQTRFADGQSLSLYVDAREPRDSAHAFLTCITCHDDREVCPPYRDKPLDFAAYQSEATEMCIRCHLAAAGDYVQSVHGQPILEGSGDGATCSDCHSPELSGHSVVRLDDPRSSLAPQSVDGNCGRCHAKELTTYRDTSHSKVARFGDPERPANCTTCHGDHAVKAIDDPDEPLMAANLAIVCGRCHDGADEAFAGGWLGHDGSSRFAGFFVAERSVVALIAVSLCFGLVHMALDFRRRLSDRWRGDRDNP
jgi:hypothetical protein